MAERWPASQVCSAQIRAWFSLWLHRRAGGVSPLLTQPTAVAGEQGAYAPRSPERSVTQALSPRHKFLGIKGKHHPFMISSRMFVVMACLDPSNHPGVSTFMLTWFRRSECPPGSNAVLVKTKIRRVSSTLTQRRGASGGVSSRIEPSRGA
jgi:hypothetical protein